MVLHRARKAMGFLVLVGVLLAACSRGTPTGAPTSKDTAGKDAPPAANVPDDMKPLKEPYKIAVGGTNNLFGTVFETAVEKGFFLKHGIQASIKIFSTGQEAAKALSTGDVQLGTSAMNNFQTELASGIKHAAIMTHMGNGASLIMDEPLAVTARAGSGIEPGKPETLKGKTIGLSLGGTAEFYLRAVLAKAKIDPKDVKMVNVPPANSVSVLQNKSVDAVSSWEPFQSLVLKDVPGSMVVTRAGGYIGYVIFDLVEDKLVKENPDLVLRMVAAYSEAAQWTRQNRDGAGDVATHWIQGLDAKLAADALKNVPFDPRITSYSKQAWDMSNDLLKSQGKIKETPPMEGNFNTTFLDKVMKDHPEYFSDLPSAQVLSFKQQ